MESSHFMGHERGLRLLLQALDSGSHGTLAALRVMQNIPGPFPWRSITEWLCREIPTLNGPAAILTMKPALFCLPKQSQRNLYSFFNLFSHLLPSSCVGLLSHTVLTNEGYSDVWLNSLARKLLGDTEIHFSKPKVMEELQMCCKGLSPNANDYSKLGWCKKPDIVIPRKRKVCCDEDTFMDQDFGPSVKRTCTEDRSVTLPKNSISQENKNKTDYHASETQELTKQMKARILRLKEILHADLDAEAWDDSFKTDLKEVWKSSSPEQLQNIFSSLSISQISPQSLYQLCCLLNSVSPDLSYAHSSALAKSLFLEQALSLTAPAPRPFLAALSMFCMKYAQSACSTLIGPLVLQAATGSVYTDFLYRVLFECLPLEHLPQCLRPVLEVPLCEGTVNILHMLLEKQILPSDIELLTNVVNANQTFMKKSLLVVLNKIRETTKPAT
uniref:Fanconi Anaemia group E protein C-terminal domain-containing protein n=1 Tax=Leptobrachium leishanense TaxID=445787 RepID=A0A8C5M5J0_9ANUR